MSSKAQRILLWDCHPDLQHGHTRPTLKPVGQKVGHARAVGALNRWVISSVGLHSAAPFFLLSRPWGTVTSLTLLVPSTAFRTHLAGPSLLGADDDAIVLYVHRTRGFMATAPGKMRLAVKIIYWRDVDKALLIANSKFKGNTSTFLSHPGNNNRLQ